MVLLKRIDEDVIKALKAGKRESATVLRGLKSDIKYKQIESGEEPTDKLVLAVLGSAAKKRRDSIDQFRNAGRDDLADKEQSELDIIMLYLPKQMSEDELRPIIKAALEESGIDSIQKIGDVMKILMPKVKGKADGKLVNRIVTEMLANL